MAMGKRKSLRERRVIFRLSESEYEAVEKMAKASGLDISKFVRFVLLKKSLTEMSDKG